MLALPVCQEPVKFTNGEGLVVISPCARAFARMVAYPAADCRERMILTEQFDGFLVFALVDQGDIALDAHMCRAGGLARRGPALADGVGAGDGLCVFFKRRSAFGKILVVFI